MLIPVEQYDKPVISPLFGRSGYVHSIFRHAIVLSIKDAMVSLVVQERGKGPGFLIIPGMSDFTEIPFQPDARVSVSKASIIITSNTISTEPEITLDLSQSIPFDSAELLFFSNESSFPGQSTSGLSLRNDTLPVGHAELVSASVLLKKDTGEQKSASILCENACYLASFLVSWEHEKKFALSQAVLLGDNSKREVIYINSVLKELVLALQASDKDRIRNSIRRTIGLGWGLTPMGDDVILGIIGVATMLGQVTMFQELFCSRARFLRELLRETISADITRTGFISGEFLRYALENRWTDILARTIAWLIDGSPKNERRILEQILEYGASSGFDILIGILAGLVGTGILSPTSLPPQVAGFFTQSV